jgi:hypothetical protein
MLNSCVCSLNSIKKDVINRIKHPSNGGCFRYTVNLDRILWHRLKMSVMKRYMHIMMIGILWFFYSCNDRGNSTETLSNTLQEDSWRVSSFDYADRDLTGSYKGYKFTFTVQNTVTAIGVNFYAGKWFVKNDGDGLMLTLEFTKISPIQLLNYDWKVISYDTQMISLYWDNPYAGGQDYLIFEKL